jgi:hypothetical protein
LLESSARTLAGSGLTVMKKVAIAILVALLGVGGVPRASASTKNNSKSAAKADRKMQKKQAKAMKKYLKAQKKAQQKMIKKDRKNTHLPTHY